MVDTLVEFLGASFAGGGQRALDARRNGADLSAFELRLRRPIARSDWRFDQAATAGPAEVVAAAEQLHEADHAVHYAALDDPAIPSPERWRALRDSQAAARSGLLDASRSPGTGPQRPHRPHKEAVTALQQFLGDLAGQVSRPNQLAVRYQLSRSSGRSAEPAV
jgi:hypothetical protein